MIGAVGDAVAQLIAVVNVVLVPAGGVAHNPVALLVWMFLVLSLLAAVWTFLRSLMRRRTPTTNADARSSVVTSNSAARPRRRTRVQRERTEPARLGVWTRVFIRLGMVSLTIDEFRSLNKADRTRYAGDKRYDPRYFASASEVTEAERRAFDRDRLRRVQARLARHGWVDPEAASTTPRRRRSLPDWMQPDQAQPGSTADRSPSVAEPGIDPLTGAYNAEWARLSDPDYQIPPEHPAYVALFDRPEQAAN
jgi:hypothetical protein